jgi:hypothetical protein
VVPPEGGSADVGSGRGAVELVAFGGNPVGKPGGLPSLFEPMVDDSLSGVLSTFEAAHSVVDGGLVARDLSVEAGDLGRHVGGATLLGVGFSPGPLGSFLTAGVAVPPAGTVFGRPLGLLSLRAGFGKVSDRSPGRSARPDSAASLEVDSSLPGRLESLFGLAQGGSPVG